MGPYRRLWAICATIVLVSLILTLSDWEYDRSGTDTAAGQHYGFLDGDNIPMHIKNYTVKVITTDYGFRGQPYEILNAPVASTSGAEQTTVSVFDHSWQDLKQMVAFVILITSCEDIYAHQNLNELVSVFFVYAKNDKEKVRSCLNSIPAEKLVYVDENVNHDNNALKMNAGYNRAIAEFSIVFKMDPDCVINTFKLKEILNYMALHRNRTYYVGEMMANNQPNIRASGMLYGVSNFRRQKSMEKLAVEDPEDVTFGTWIQQRLTHRLNLAHLYFGRSKRHLLPSCDWLVIHNSPLNDVPYDYDCSHVYGTVEEFVTANIRSDHHEHILEVGKERS